jgi:antitoxin CcdA
MRMKHDPIGTGKRKSVNLSLDEGVIESARAAGVNMSKISEGALRREVQRIRDVQWQEDNREWIKANNAWVEKNGLPLERYRLF